LGPCEPSTRSDKLFKTAVHKALQSKEMIEGLKALFFFEESGPSTSWRINRERN
jgi:hypothetical protein